MVTLIILVAPIAGRLSDRVGSRWLMGGGMTLVGISLLLYERVDRPLDFWTLLPSMILGGVGMAMTMSPMTSAAMGVRARRQGGRRLRRPQQLPPGRRLARDRGDGRDPRFVPPPPAAQPAGRAGLRQRAPRGLRGRRGRSRSPRRSSPSSPCGRGPRSCASTSRSWRHERRGAAHGGGRPPASI